MTRGRVAGMTRGRASISRAGMILLATLAVLSAGCGKYGRPIRADGSTDHRSRNERALDDLPPNHEQRYEPIVDETLPVEPVGPAGSEEWGEGVEVDEPDPEARDPSDAGDESDE